MLDLTDFVTERLSLRPMAVTDAEELFPILSDPASWWYEPARRHPDLATTVAYTERAAARWLPDGLSYWTVRKLSDGTVIGHGGVQRHRSGSWNLSYRIATAERGNGYGTELARAGIAAANQQDPASAVIAWVLENNPPSQRIAERVGLTNYGVRVDVSDGVERIAFADRPI